MAFLDERLSPSNAAEIALHLDRCPLCQARADSLLSWPTWAPKLFPDAAAESASSSFARRPSSRDQTADTITDPGVPLSSHESLVVGSVPQPGSLLGNRLELRAMIGLGGYGTVFEAWDRQLCRSVAVKVPHWQYFEKPSVRRRFEIEARAAARLSHPGIVSVHEACINESGPSYLVSELVRGPSLETWLREQWSAGKSIPVRQAARLLAELARAMEYAHNAGVLHRDLKPSNILLAAHEDSDDVSPRITDFGLARLSEEMSQTTCDGSVFGSLHYMAPEQALAQPDVGFGCDVYALGAILYEVLTGRRPITGESPTAILQAVPIQPVVSLR